MKPLISIIVPVYKVEQYLERCVDSILAQTYQNLQIILVDDGSPDNCGRICDAYAEQDDRILVIHKENGGLSDARNCGLKHAEGAYIGFVDSDDWIAPEMFENLFNAAEEYKSDIAICGIYFVKGNSIDTDIWCEEPVILTPEEAFLALIEDKTIQNYVWNKLYKKELFHDVEFPKGRHFEDIGTTYKLFLNAQSIVQIGTPGYYYYRHPNSIVGSWKVKSLVDNLLLRQERFVNTAEMYPSSEKQQLRRYLRVLRSTMESAEKASEAELNEIQEVLSTEVYPFVIAAREKFISYFWISAEEIERIDAFTNGIAAYQQYVRQNRCFTAKLKKFAKKFIRKIRNFAKKTPLSKQFQQSRLYPLLQSRTRRNTILVMGGVANYDNLGDHAISYAQLKFLKKEFPKYNILEIYDNEWKKYRRQIKKAVRRGDIIAFQGGGNMGDLYPWFEKDRRNLIRSFPKNRIVLFPQSAFWRNQADLKRSVAIYSRHRDLHIMARERMSYDFLKQHFVKNHVGLTPDIVLSVGDHSTKQERCGALICLRNDKEGNLSKRDIAKIVKTTKKHNSDIRYTDTVDSVVMEIGREQALFAKFREFSGARVVITNRLHGMIFAAITGTPCVAMDNTYHKIKHSYEWLRDLPYIKYVDHIDDLETVMTELLNAEEYTYNSETLLPEYAALINAFKD